MHPAIRLRQIRLFVQIAGSGSLTAAAQVLGLSQPALSKSLSGLEGLLGAALFSRLGRKLTLHFGAEVVAVARRRLWPTSRSGCVAGHRRGRDDNNQRGGPTTGDCSADAPVPGFGQAAQIRTISDQTLITRRFAI